MKVKGAVGDQGRRTRVKKWGRAVELSNGAVGQQGSGGVEEWGVNKMEDA